MNVSQRPNGGERRLISVVTPCYNEEENITDAYAEIKKVREAHPEYDWEHLFIDNASVDRTVSHLRDIAAKDQDVRVIVNIKNFGHIKSHVHGYLTARGDAVIPYFCDLQDPSELIWEFIKKWEEGFKVVYAIKEESEENPVMFALRRVFYNILSMMSEADLIKNFTGFGLYDKAILDIVRQLHDPYPYFRGLVAEYGYDKIKIPYKQRKRKNGRSKNSLYILYDSAWLGLVNYSRVPLRLATLFGFALAFLSMMTAFGYSVFKLLYWDEFQLGIAPIIVGGLFIASAQLIFIGILGEYIGTILTEVKNRPLVIEKERINF
jgi:polyisoprenyl-phosphate glycosyltransferase